MDALHGVFDVLDGLDRCCDPCPPAGSASVSPS